MIDPTMFDADFEEYLRRIATLTDEVLIPAEQEMVEAGHVPEHVMDALVRHGLFGISIPRDLGGLEWSMVEQVRLTMEFTRASCVYRSRFSTVIGLCSQAILDHGTDAQRKEMLPAMAAGELVTAFALTEPEAGSDAASLRTTARRTEEGWVLDGQKRYITNAHWADVLVVFAQTDANDSTDSGDGGDGGVSAFFVPREAAGVTTRLPSRMNGHAEGPVAEIDLEGVEVEQTALLGGTTGAGFAAALRGINHARLHVAATCVGQTTRMLEETTAHVLGRRQFGGPLADLGAVQADLGRCFADLEAARALTLAAAEAFDTGVIPRHRIAAAKLFATEMASRVADRCVQLLGGEGIVGDHSVPRMWRDVRALRIYEGSSPVHERNLGRALAKQVAADGSLPDTYRVTRSAS